MTYALTESSIEQLLKIVVSNTSVKYKLWTDLAVELLCVYLGVLYVFNRRSTNFVIICNLDLALTFELENTLCDQYFKLLDNSLIYRIFWKTLSHVLYRRYIRLEQWIDAANRMNFLSHTTHPIKFLMKQ